MTLAELEKFAADIRANGGEDDTVIKMVTGTGSIKDVARTQVWHPMGNPIIVLKR